MVRSLILHVIEANHSSLKLEKERSFKVRKATPAELDEKLTFYVARVG